MSRRQQHILDLQDLLSDVKAWKKNHTNTQDVKPKHIKRQRKRERDDKEDGSPGGPRS